MFIRALVLVLVSGVSAQAATITWQASGLITLERDEARLWLGLTNGTPWSLTVDFDPAAAPLGSYGGGCNYYAVGATTLTLGGFNYTRSSGQGWTNSALPFDSCASTDLPGTPPGMVQFAWTGAWTQEASAWDLNTSPRILVAGYYDLNAGDGHLPVFPVFNPTQGIYGGLFYRTPPIGPIESFYGGSFIPHLVGQTTAVPEPATLSMLGIGLASLGFRCCRRAANREL